MATPVRVTTIDKAGKVVVIEYDEAGKAKTIVDAKREYDEEARKEVIERIRKDNERVGERDS